MTASRTRPARADRAMRPALRALCACAAAMARGRGRASAAAVAKARRAGASRWEMEECALMLMLYAGYPSALEGLRVVNAVWPGRARRTSEDSVADWRRRGEALCRRVYGPAFTRLLPAVRALHPDLAVWMVEHGYGRVLSRRGLSVVERELVTVAALSALGWERQLVSHVLGAARVGAPAAAIEEALSVGASAAGTRERAVAGRTWRRARSHLVGGAIAAQGSGSRRP